MKVKFYICAIISIIIIGCSSGRYTIADRFMKSNDYQNALEEYIRIAGMKGSIAVSRDIRALTGAMIAYYHLGSYQKSFATAKHILSFEKYNGCAIFYAGMNLEMMNKKSMAAKVYRYYTALSRFDPYRNLVKAKFKLLIQDEMEKRAQMAIKMESSISMDQIDGNTVAVLYFLNVIDDPEWNSLSKGLAEMIITDLSKVKSLKVLERIYLQKLIEEMQLGMTGLTDENTVPRMGRLMKAKNLINGAFSIKADRDLTVTSNLLDVISKTNVQSKEFGGNVDQIFDIEKEIVFAAIDQLGIRLTAEEKKQIGKFSTRNFNAFKAYCRGLDQYDLGNFSSALLFFQDATKLDPNFALAKEMFDITSALESIEHGTYVTTIFEKSKSEFALQTGAMNSMATQQRLNRLSQNLDLGFLPGNDSRNGASEIERVWDEGRWSREPLQEPPKPPIVLPN